MASITAFLFILMPLFEEGPSLSRFSSSHSVCICCTLPGFDGPFLEVEDLLAFFIVRDEQGESMRGEGGRVVDRDEGGGGICAGRGAEGIGEPEGESVSSLCRRLLVGREEEPCISRSWRCSSIELLK